MAVVTGGEGEQGDEQEDVERDLLMVLDGVGEAGLGVPRGAVAPAEAAFR